MTRLSFLIVCIVAVTPPAICSPPDVPLSARESIEWSDVWISNADKGGLPRVLLIGDSITSGYYPVVEKKLAGKAYVARLSTSRFVSDPVLLGEIALLLDNTKFEMIHFNNGLHGWQHSEQQYREHFPGLLNTFKKHAPNAKLIWATTTPVRESDSLNKLDSRTERVKTRNLIAGDMVATHDVQIDDLFRLVDGRPDYYLDDGVHFTTAGNAALGEQVAAQIEKLLMQRRPE